MKVFIKNFFISALCLNTLDGAEGSDPEKAPDSPIFTVIGTMSGTSMDGIDVAALKTDGEYNIKELEHTSLSYSREFHLLLKTAEYTVRRHQGNLQEVEKDDLKKEFIAYLTEVLGLPNDKASAEWETSRSYLKLDATTPLTFNDIVHHSTDLHAQAIQMLLSKMAYSATQIDLIGYHGQTLYHNPAQRITIQVGDGLRLARLTGITVINDFRSRDVKSGGQGAPFAPLYHHALAFRDIKKPVVVANFGGIANPTFNLGPSYDQIFGFDSGPGNRLIDLYVKRETKGQEMLDLDGQYGSKGHVHEDILQKLYEKSTLKNGRNYFKIIPPKSLDINDLNLIPEIDALSFEDACRTLEAFSADTLVQSVDLVPGLKPEHWILAGGGWNNPVIKEELRTRLTKKYQDEYDQNVTIKTADEIGWSSKALEAQIFAYLGVRSLLGKPISIPQTTGVPYPLSGGHAHPSKTPTPLVGAALGKNLAVLKGYQE